MVRLLPERLLQEESAVLLLRVAEQETEIDFVFMATSLLSAGALASCAIQNLSKFGVFFALTIAYAYLWSIFFLMPLLATIGPEGEAKADAGTEMSGTRAVKKVATDKDGDAQA